MGREEVTRQRGNEAEDSGGKRWITRVDFILIYNMVQFQGIEVSLDYINPSNLFCVDLTFFKSRLKTNLR